LNTQKLPAYMSQFWNIPQEKNMLLYPVTTSAVEFCFYSCRYYS